jgi:2-polyprenyl-3-methyl-5-hydroxy-6-metoxy-1,4-benzoquinol methylase
MACFACGSDRAPDRVRISSEHSIAFCPVCGSGRSESPPAPEAFASMYGGDYYQAWGVHETGSRTELLKRATFARRLDDCAPWMRSGGKVLDLGCATGFFLREAQEHGYEGFGIDVSAHAIGQCAMSIDRDRLHCGEFESSTFGTAAGDRFDAIFMSDYLEHVLNPSAVLALAADRLAPAGVVVITTPDVGSFSRRVMGRRWPHFKPEHVSYFSRKGLARLLRSMGFALVNLRPTRKALSIAYVAAQFRRYPNPWITSWLQPLHRLLPVALTDAIVWIPTGEVTAVARKAF